MTAHTLRRATSRLLVVIGVTTLLCSGFVWATASYDESTRVNAALPALSHVEAPGRGSTLGRLEVPRLGLSTIVIEGDDEYNLLVGAGHLPETPLPWHDGNSVLAGHRDTDFRPLRNIQAGDTIQFHTADIIVEYIVRETEIVEPTDLTVLRATDVPTLTLITCYPFTYVGPAPKRFVVRAERTTTATKSDSKIASDSA
jgi:sortase A